MRQKLEPGKKRDNIIGVKVDSKTRAQIDYIASANGDKTSTYIYDLIKRHIEDYTKMTKTNWENELK